MGFNSLIITGCEIIAAVLLIYGFTQEQKIARWERQTVRKVKKFIYNLIVKLEG